MGCCLRWAEFLELLRRRRKEEKPIFKKNNLRNISRGVKSRAAGGVLKIHFSKGDFRTPINANEIAVPNEAE